jgi:hypothetical protein
LLFIVSIFFLCKAKRKRDEVPLSPKTFKEEDYGTAAAAAAAVAVAAADGSG